MPNRHPLPGTTAHETFLNSLPKGSAVPGRQPGTATTKDVEQASPEEYLAASFAQLRRDMRGLVMMSADVTKPVDEYRVQGWLADSETTINVQPQWEFAEKIDSIIVTGPTGNVVVQLGDRNWPLTIPASGIIVVAPIGMMLGRNDVRQLTASTPGQYSLELMGYADVRWAS